MDLSEAETTNATQDLFFNFYTKLENICMHNDKNGGYKTGFEDYDNLTHGLQKSELTVIAGRHSMGKSSFVLNIAINLAEQNIPVLYVSYDLDKTAVALRIIAALSEFDGNKIKEGFLTQQSWEKIINALNIASELSKKNLQIEANCYLYYKDLFDLIRKFKDENSEGVVIVDYFQLIKLYKQEDVRIIELSSLAAAFKHLAMEIEMPIILVSQVSKKCEERSDKRPILSDLAECDALAQHCDNLVFLYRDEYYDKDDTICENRNIAEFNIAKQKNGPCGTIKLLYQANIFKFKNPVRHYEF